jgi:hypothetical protein
MSHRAIFGWWVTVPAVTTWRCCLVFDVWLRVGIGLDRGDRCCRGVRTVASIVIRVGVRVCVFGGSGGLKNTRTTERTQQFILVQAD